MLSVPFRTILRLRGMDLPSSFRVYIGRVNLYKPYPHPGLRICSGKIKSVFYSYKEEIPCADCPVVVGIIPAVQ